MGRLAKPICGTDAGFQRHKRDGKPPCEACKQARQVYVEQWRAANPEKMALYKSRASTYSQVGHRAWVDANPDRLRSSKLLERYGIDSDQWSAIFEWQDFKCACCGEASEDAKPRQWQVDHNHETHQLRGILCARCNRLLGQLGDTARAVHDYASKILQYLANSGDVP